MLVDTPRQLQDAVAALERVSKISIDTETNGLHAYQSRVCVIQASDGERAWLIDTLAFPDASLLKPLLDIFVDPNVLKILHGASHDVASVKLDYGIAFNNIFDTHIAAQYLSYEKIGLSDLVGMHFHVVLEKQLQKKDWGKRPLLSSDLEYLRRDVQYLIPLHDLLVAELERADLVEEVRCECARVENTPALGETFDAEGFWRMKGSRELSDSGLAFLKRLYRFRDETARRWNRPPFKTISDAYLLEMAAADSRKKLEESRFFQRANHHVRPLLRKVLAEFELSRKEARPSRKRTTKQIEQPRVNRNKRIELEAELKKWRAEEAGRRKLNPSVVLPNHAIECILATESVLSLHDLERVPYFGAGRTRKYGQEIVKLVNEINGRR